MNRSLLHKAAEKGHLDVIKYLIEEKQYNAEPRDDNGNTPLHVAAYFGQLDIVKFFVIKQNISINAVNNDGKTPLENTANKNIIDFLTYYKCPICRPWKLIVIIISGNIFIVIILFIFRVIFVLRKMSSKDYAYNPLPGKTSKNGQKIVGAPISGMNIRA